MALWTYSELLLFSAVKVWLSCSNPAHCKERSGSWLAPERISKTLEYPTWQKCCHLPVALNHARELTLTVWLLVELSGRFRNGGQTQGCSMLMWLTQVKPWTLSLCALPWVAILHTCCHTLFLGGLSAMHMTPPGEDNKKLVPGLIADFNLYPFTAMKSNWVSELFGVLWGLLVSHWNEGWSWGPSATPSFQWEGLSLHSSLQLVFSTPPVNSCKMPPIW